MILCFKVQGLGFFGAGSFFRVQGCGLYGLGCGVYCGLVALRIHRSSSATSASASRKPRTIATCTSRMIAMQVSAAVLSGASAVPSYNYSIMDPNALLKIIKVPTLRLSDNTDAGRTLFHASTTKNTDQTW